MLATLVMLELTFGLLERQKNVPNTEVAQSGMAVESNIWISRGNNFGYSLVCSVHVEGRRTDGAPYCYYGKQVADGFFPDAVQNRVDCINRVCRRYAANRPLFVYSGKE